MANSDTLWLSVDEAAKRTGVHPNTVRKWMRKGRLRLGLTPGGRTRIDADSLAPTPIPASDRAPSLDHTLPPAA